jgi:cephalosporin-C deacetylase-like acetyl esterase
MDSIVSYLKEKKEFFFKGETDKNPLTYSANEKMVFTLKLLADGEIVKLPHAKIRIDSDDGRLEEFYLEPDENGIFTLETSLSRDGYLRVMAWACDEEKNIIEDLPLFEGGAGADIDRIKCETDEPDDYFEFWDRVKKEAAEIKPEIIFEKELKVKEGFIGKEYHLKSTAGDYASCVVVYPEDAKDKSLPIHFQYIGYAVTSVWLEHFPDRILVFANAHDIENFREQSYYDKLLESPKYKSYGFNREENQSPDTTYWKKMFIRNFQVFNYFKNHAKGDGKNFIFQGGSQGAFQACNMAAHSGVATQCNLDVPWFCDLYAIEKEKRLRGWRPEPDGGLRYFDTAVAAKHLTCHVHITAGLGDYVCPPSGVTALYNAISCEKKLDFVQGRTHSYIPPILDTFTIKEK